MNKTINENVSKERLIERLETEYKYKYQSYPEGELPEDFQKRCLEGNGFLNAVRIVVNFK